MKLGDVGMGLPNEYTVHKARTAMCASLKDAHVPSAPGPRMTADCTTALSQGISAGMGLGLLMEA